MTPVRMILQFIAAYLIFGAAYGLVMGVLMADAYAAMVPMFRPGGVMAAVEHGGYVLQTLALIIIFNRFVASNSWKDGALYGALIGMIYAGVAIVMYAYYPMPDTIMMVEVVSSILITMLAGIAVALIYKK